MKYFLIALIFILVIYLYNKWFKIPKLNNVVMVSGAVKSGKTALSLHFAMKKYRSALRVYYLKKFFFIFFPKKKVELEKPLLYSNIPLATDYVPLTEDLILRKCRFAYGSVIFIDEASLVADSMDYKDESKNDALRLFNKLIAHETMGGTVIYNSQALNDMHFSIKRCISTYYYVHHIVTWLPFFVVAYVRELFYDDTQSSMNVFEDDVEVKLRRVLYSKSIWKKYDCYTYSKLTDSLPVVNNVVEGAKLADLKSDSYLHLKKEKKAKKE